MKTPREATTSITVYKSDRDALFAEAQKRVKAWEKRREGNKPWIADVVAEMRKKKN